MNFTKRRKLANQLEPDGYVFIHLGLVDLDSSRQISKDGIAKFAHECGVHYLGFKDNIKDLCRSSDVVVLPSYREGTPRSLIEALALGKFIVATDTAGCRETVIDGSMVFCAKLVIQNLLLKNFSL